MSMNPLGVLRSTLFSIPVLMYAIEIAYGTNSRSRTRTAVMVFSVVMSRHAHGFGGERICVVSSLHYTFPFIVHVLDHIISYKNSSALR